MLRLLPRARRLRALLCVFLPLAAAGCGPVLIGAGVASAGGGGGSGPTAPSASASVFAEQPQPERTFLGFTLQQDAGRAVRCFLTYTIDGRSERIAENRVARWIGGAPQPFGFHDPVRRHWLLPAAAGGENYVLEWDHAASLGVVERAGVRIDLHFADGQTTDETRFRAPVALFDGVVGQANGSLALAVTRRGAEDDFAVGVTLTDPGGDKDVSRFDVEVRYDDGGQPSDWVRVHTQVPLDGARVADDPPTFRLDAVVDPFAADLPRRRLGRVDFRARVCEDHGLGGRVRGAKLAPSPWATVSSSDEAIGVPPRIDRIQPPGGVRPFRVPIAVVVGYPTRRPGAVRIRLRGYFATGSRAEQIMTLANPDAQGATSRVIDVAANATTTEYLVWDVLADLGLGLNPDLQPETAAVRVVASLEDPLGRKPGSAIETSATAAATVTLDTAPFVNFAPRLLVAQGHNYDVFEPAASGGVERRFVRTAAGTNTELNRVFVDQQFDPVPIPGLQPYDFPNGPGEGVLHLIPTDFAAGPSCIVSRGDRALLHYIEWPMDPVGPNPPVRSDVVLRSGFDARDVTGASAPLHLEVEGMPAVMFSGAELRTPPFSYSPLLLVRDAGPPVSWIDSTATFEFGMQPGFGYELMRSNYPLLVVPGEFAGAGRATVVVADASAFYGAGRGLLGVLEVVPGSNGSATFRFVESLPVAAELQLAPDVEVTRLFLLPWRERRTDAYPGIMCVRELLPRDASAARVECWRIEQVQPRGRDPGGGFAGQSWIRLPDIDGMAAVDPRRFGFSHAFAADLDRDGRSDLLLGYGGAYDRSADLGAAGLGSFSVSGPQLMRDQLAYDVRLTAPREADSADLVFADRSRVALDFFDDRAPRQIHWRFRGTTPSLTPAQLASVAAGTAQLEVTPRGGGPVWRGSLLGDATTSRGIADYRLLANQRDRDGNSLPSEAGLWRRLFAAPLAVTSPADYRALIPRRLLDVNGDGFQDLVLEEREWSYQHRLTYVASAFSGAIRNLQQPSAPFGQAPPQASAAPAVFDLDRDGFEDLVSRGVIHLQDAKGEFTQGRSGFGGTYTSRYWLERVVLRGRKSNEIDVLVYDPDDPSVPTGLTCAEIGSSPRPCPEVPAVEVLARSVRSARPFLTAVPDATTPAKDLAVVLPYGSGELRLWRYTLVATAGGLQFEPGPAPLVDQPIGDALAAVRIGDGDGTPAAWNTRPQDLFVASPPTDPARIYWLRHDDLAAPRTLQPMRDPSRERVLGLANAAIDGDARDDLAVLTAEQVGSGAAGYLLFRVYLARQTAGDGFGAYAAPGSAEVILLYERPLSGERPEGFAFDPDAPRLGGGVVLANDEIRLLQPTAVTGGLRVRMLRSPIDLPSPRLRGASVVASDFDHDGRLEIVAGQLELGSGRAALFRFDRSFRASPSGQ